MCQSLGSAPESKGKESAPLGQKSLDHFTLAEGYGMQNEEAVAQPLLSQ